MSKTKFINDIWICGNYQNMMIIGRTTIIKNKEMVVFVSENSTISTVEYSEIKNISKLNILDNSKNNNFKKSETKSIIESFKVNIQKNYNNN